jgi:hypothetical protein
MDWINLVWDRDYWRVLVNTAISLRVTQITSKFLSNWVTGSFEEGLSSMELVGWLVTTYIILQQTSSYIIIG